MPPLKKSRNRNHKFSIRRVACHMCTGNTLKYLQDSSKRSFDSAEKTSELCKKHELEMALLSFPNYSSDEKRTSSPRAKNRATEADKLTKEEENFLHTFFYRFGVKECEIKRHCIDKGISVRRFISELESNMSLLMNYGGSPAQFTHSFYIGNIYPPRIRVGVFQVSLKDYLETCRNFSSS